LQTAGVGAALSVNSKGQVVFSQMVPGMPAANSGAIHIGDSLVAVDEWEVPTFKGTNHTTDLKPNELLISISKRILGLAGTHVRLTLLKSSADDQLVSEHSSSRDLTSEGQQVREAVCQDSEAGRKGRLTLRYVHVNLVR
jgi:C-terminal processing protease CtpA/Prc